MVSKIDILVYEAWRGNSCPKNPCSGSAAWDGGTLEVDLEYLAGSKKARTPPNREGLDNFATNKFRLIL